MPFLVAWNYAFINDLEQNFSSVVNLFCNNGTSTLEQKFKNSFLTKFLWNMCEVSRFHEHIFREDLFFYKKLRIWASTQSFLKLSDFEYSEFLTNFLQVPLQSSCSLTAPS